MSEANYILSICYKWKNIYKNACMYTEKVTYIFIKLELDYLLVIII
jgi:hypothetical protein